MNAKSKLKLAVKNSKMSVCIMHKNFFPEKFHYP